MVIFFHRIYSRSPFGMQRQELVKSSLEIVFEGRNSGSWAKSDCDRLFEEMSMLKFYIV